MKKVVFINTGGPKMRYSLENAKKRGYYVSIVKFSLEDWEKELCDEWIQADTYNLDSILKKLEEHFEKNQADAIVTFSEFDVPTAVLVQERFGLPVITELDPNYLRDKSLMRKHLELGGFLVPKNIKANTKNEILTFLKSVSSPIVIKPVSGADSLYVKKICNEKELEEIWPSFYKQFLHNVPLKFSRLSEFQVEEYMPGLEMSIETATFNGKTQLITITDKHPVSEPYFIETGHKYPTCLDEHTQSKIFDVVSRVLTHFRIKNAVCHTELRWFNNNVYIGEIAGRPGGGTIPRLIMEASGYDLSDPVFDIALRLSPKTEVKWETGISSRAIPSPGIGRIQGITGLNLAKEVNGVKTVDLYREVGEELPNPPKEFINLGKVIAVASTSDEADSNALKAISYINVKYV